MRLGPMLVPALCALLLASTLLLPGLARGETMHQVTLLDGSVLQGLLVSMSDTEVILSTDYADSLRIPRDQIKAIVLGGAETPAATNAPAPPAGVGLLEVTLVGDPPRSSARFRRPAERDRLLKLNTLYFKVFVDGALLYTDSDATMEKEYIDSGWTLLRNDHEFPPAKLELPAGAHRVLVVVGNELGDLVQGEKQSQLCSAELMVEEVLIRPNEKTRLALGGDGSRFKYGKYKLKLMSSH